MLSERRSLLLGLAALGVVVGCGDGQRSATDGTITVFAASSLSAAFDELGEAFSETSPGLEVVFNFAGSAALATQIVEGAPADVFASADLGSMTKLTDAGNGAGDPVVFTTNTAQIIVAAGNPEGVTGVADLADPGLIVIACAPEVPCGAYARQIFTNAGVSVTPRSFEENVKAVVSKVTLGEADAGIVYATDVAAAGDAAWGVDIPAELNIVAEYPIAVTTGAPNPAAAQAFVDFVLSAAGQEILASFGFVAP